MNTATRVIVKTVSHEVGRTVRQSLGSWGRTVRLCLLMIVATAIVIVLWKALHLGG
jgi:hypothetical protein